MLLRASPTSSAEIFIRQVDAQLASLRKAGRVSDSAISRKATGNPDALRSIRRALAQGKHVGVSSETVFKFAQALGTTPTLLLSPLVSNDRPDDYKSALEFWIASL